MRELIISDLEQNQRLDKFLGRYLNDCPKSFIYKCIRTNKIKLNGKKVKGNEILQTSDTLKIFLLEEQFAEFQSEKIIPKTKITFDILFEDENLLVVNKPIGLLTQKDTPTSHSLADEILSYLGATSFVPAPCNRLDRNTAGIVLVGKNLPATQALSEMLKEKMIAKYYISVVRGNLQNEISLEAFHIKDDFENKVSISNTFVEGAKPIKTIVKPLSNKDDYTIVEIELITGKTHQIRAQLAHIGYPIIGDTKYGDKSINKNFALKHQFLCAYRVQFNCCVPFLEYLTNKEIVAPLPSNYETILAKLK